MMLGFEYFSICMIPPLHRCEIQIPFFENASNHLSHHPKLNYLNVLKLYQNHMDSIQLNLLHLNQKNLSFPSLFNFYFFNFLFI